ncbi:6-phosphogluconolactonase [Camelimonas abortus]|uniref:6-phosphogluconolactonase n=1 Tax=Camelimonas abortus TaxID=1017184 RepID=A0ABV7LGH3_9HYPH
MALQETIISADLDGLAANAALWLLEALADAEAEGARRLRVCLSGGSTPQRLYALLAAPAWSARLPWEKIEWYFGDDRFVPHDHPDSNARMAREALFDHAPATAGRVHYIPWGPDIVACAAAYERTLRAAMARDREEDPGRPLFDAVICGLGRDGHTASLFPGKPALAVTDRLATAVPEAGQPPFTPRITLTFPALNDSRFTAFLVAGADKRPALERLRAGADLPAARITAKRCLTWLLDRAAAGADAERPAPGVS